MKNSDEVQAISLSTQLARKLTLQFWKSEMSPTFELWLKKLDNVLQLEKIRHTVTMRGAVSEDMAKS